MSCQKNLVRILIGFTYRNQQIKRKIRWILNIKLKYLNKENATRRKTAKYYLENIRNKNLILPTSPKDISSHVWHLFVIRTSERRKFIQFLEENKIQTILHYPIAPHKQQAFKEFDKNRMRLNDLSNLGN